MLSRRRFLGLPAAAIALAATIQPVQAAAPEPEPVASLAQYTELVECIIFTALVVNVHSASLLHQLGRIQRLEGMVRIPDFHSYTRTLENLSKELQEKITHARHALHL
jgi:hypothetical protein